MNRYNTLLILTLLGYLAVSCDDMKSSNKIFESNNETTFELREIKITGDQDDDLIDTNLDVTIGDQVLLNLSCSESSKNGIISLYVQNQTDLVKIKEMYHLNDKEGLSQIIKSEVSGRLFVELWSMDDSEVIFDDLELSIL